MLTLNLNRGTRLTLRQVELICYAGRRFAFDLGSIRFAKSLESCIFVLNMRTAETKVLILACFILAVVVLPTTHTIALTGASHGSSETHRHDDEHCAICQIVHTPVVVGAPVVSPASVAAISLKNVPVYPQPAVLKDRHALPFACGPPS